MSAGLPSWAQSHALHWNAGVARATNLRAIEDSGLVARLSLLIESIDAAGRLDAG